VDLEKRTFIIAIIYLNGTEVGNTNNMFRRYIFDVKNKLVEGSNTLRIRFRSTAAYCKEQAESSPYPHPLWEYPHGIHHKNYVRKCGCHFGWDWGPAFGPCGIVAPVSVVGFSGAFVDDVATAQKWLEGDSVELTLKVHFRLSAARAIDAVAHIVDPEGKQTIETEHYSDVNIKEGENVIYLKQIIKHPLRWWPAGYGDQPLYTVKVFVSSKESGGVYS
jgi:beta-mannosidase